MNRTLTTPSLTAVLVEHRHRQPDGVGDQALDALGCGSVFAVVLSTCVGANTMADPRLEETEMFLDQHEVRAIRDAMTAWLDR